GIRERNVTGVQTCALPIFDGAVLVLGALGVVTHLTLDLVAAFEVRQSVHLAFPPDRMEAADLLGMLAGGYSVSLFHHWDGHIAQIGRASCRERGWDTDWV